MKYLAYLKKKLRKVGKTLEKWKDEIENFFNTGITNAFTEGKNISMPLESTKAKLLKRMAYGYKNKDNYIKEYLKKSFVILKIKIF